MRKSNPPPGDRPLLPIVQLSGPMAKRDRRGRPELSTPCRMYHWTIDVVKFQVNTGGVPGNLKNVVTSGSRRLRFWYRLQV